MAPDPGSGCVKPFLRDVRNVRKGANRPAGGARHKGLQALRKNLLDQTALPAVDSTA